MLRIFRHYVPLTTVALALVEIGLIFGVFVLSYRLHFPDAAEIPREVATYVSAAWAGLIFLPMFSLGLYNRALFSRRRDMAVRILLSFFLTIPIYLAAAPWLYSLFPDSGGIEFRFPFIRGMALGLLAIALSRFFVLPLISIETLKRRVLVLGIGDLAAKIESLAEGGRFVVVGYVRVNPEAPRIRGRWLEAEPGTARSSIAQIADQNFVDEVVVATRDRRGLPVDDLLDCKLDGVNIIEYLSFWEREKGQIDLDALQPSWFVFSDGFVFHWFPHFLKRLFDVVVSFLFLLLTAPVMAAAMLAIRLESAGPIFYVQERVGLNGRRFRLMKFRSMAVNAENDGPRWAATNDQRITRVGAFIRKTRIDEIPQVINVLRGDMSFIGPRPERPFFVDALAKEIPYYLERHRVKPGISGWAQINYPYGASVEDARQKLTYDLYYVKNRSLFLDLVILLQTARVVLWPEGVR